MRAEEEKRLVERMQRLEGLNASAIARASGIPRSTVRDWLRRRPPRPNEDCARCGHSAHNYRALPGVEYAYLLGMYLGDGVISRARREVYRLRISTDAQYPGIIGECVAAIERVLPANSVSFSTQLTDGSPWSARTHGRGRA
jgi:hypothetical protein